MADLQRIQFKRSSVAGKKPTTSQLAVGELAINLTDRTLYTSTGTAIIDLGFAKGGQVDGNITQTGNITSTGTIKATKLEGPLTGNASTATTLQTARTISLGGDLSGSASFNGSANITITGTVKDDSHDHTLLTSISSYSKTADDLPSTWGKGVQSLFVNAETGFPSFGTVLTARGATNTGGTLQLYTPYSPSYGGSSLKYRASDYSVNNGDSWGDWKDLVDSASISNYAPSLTGTGASGTWGISVSGNAATATKLATARTINGTSFNGSANITTTNWGTARTIMVGKSSKSVNGSANVGWTLAEIGAVNKDGDTMTGGLTILGAASAKPLNVRAIQGITTDGSITGATGLYLNFNDTTTKTYFNGETHYIQGGTYTGNAATATKLATARTIGGVSFDGTANINLPGVNTAGNQNTSGNAATATKLQTARTIGGVSFDGSANINLPGVNATGNQNTSGNAASATKLATARTIGGVSFDGTANVNLPGVNTAGNQNTSGNAATATKLQTARTINGTSFNGTADITVPVDVVAIPSNADLNTYQTPGFYSCAASATAGSLSNSPTAVAFSMLVETHAGVRQTITEYTTSEYKIYVRNFYANTWGSWSRIYTTHDAPTSVTGNAATATKLTTARTIAISGAVTGTATSFDGSANIAIATTAIDGSKISTGTIPAARIPTLNQSTTGNAATATKLATARTINGVSFDGTANITLPVATTSATGTVQLNNTLTSTASNQALTAAQGKALEDKKLNLTGGTVSGNLTVSGTFTANIKPLLNATGSAPVFACRAWATFNSVNTLKVLNHGNIATITKDTTAPAGTYIVTFTTPMPHADYAIFFSISGGSADTISPRLAASSVSGNLINKTVNGFTFYNGNGYTTTFVSFGVFC